MHVTAVSLLLCCAALAQQPAPPAAAPQPIDFQKVDRTPPKLPASDAPRLYGIYLFGLQGEHRVWAVLEGATTKEHGPKVLYFDLDGNGDLTAPGERFEGKPAGKASSGKPGPADVKFALGSYQPPGSDATHEDFTITWTAALGVRFKTIWRGSQVSFGGYGPSHDQYVAFADSPQQAPVFVPGWDRPFEFERWIAEPLKRGGSTDFRVFVGNRGDRVGAFAAVDDKFLPADEFAVATLHYRDQDGKPQTERFELKQRC
jgi:hypothetical protein